MFSRFLIIPQVFYYSNYYFILMGVVYHTTIDFMSIQKLFILLVSSKWSIISNIWASKIVNELLLCKTRNWSTFWSFKYLPVYWISFTHFLLTRSTIFTDVELIMHTRLEFNTTKSITDVKFLTINLRSYVFIIVPLKSSTRTSCDS